MAQKQQSSIAQNAVLRVILNVFNVIIPIITGPYLARTLDVQLYGIYNQSLSLVGFLLPFAGFGIYNYGIREISKLKHDEKKLSKLFTMLFSVGAVSSILVLVVYLAYLIGFAEYNHESIYFVMSLQIIAAIFNVEYMNEAYENYKFIVYKTLLVRILNVFLILLCVRKPDDVLVYAFIYSFLQFLNYFLSFISIKSKVIFSRISWSDIRSILKPLAIMFVLMNCSMLYTNLDRLIMSFATDGVYVTYYTFSQVIINLFINVMNSIIIVTLPRLSAYIGKQDFDSYKALVSKSSSVFFMLGIPMCFGFFVLSDIIMFLYGGAQYIDAGTTFAIFSLRMLVWMIEYVIANQILFIQGYEKKITAIYFVGGGMNLIVKLLLAFGNVLDSETAIFSTAIIELFVVFTEIYVIKKEQIEGLQGVVKKYFSYFAMSILFVAIAFVNRKLIPFSYAFELKLILYVGVTVLECVAVYVLALAVTKDSNYQDAKAMIIRKLRSMK